MHRSVYSEVIFQSPLTLLGHHSYCMETYFPFNTGAYGLHKKHLCTNMKVPNLNRITLLLYYSSVLLSVVLDCQTQPIDKSSTVFGKGRAKPLFPIGAAMAVILFPAFLQKYPLVCLILPDSTIHMYTWRVISHCLKGPFFM